MLDGRRMRSNDGRGDKHVGSGAGGAATEMVPAKQRDDKGGEAGSAHRAPGSSRQQQAVAPDLGHGTPSDVDPVKAFEDMDFSVYIYKG